MSMTYEYKVLVIKHHLRICKDDYNELIWLQSFSIIYWWWRKPRM